MSLQRIQQRAAAVKKAADELQELLDQMDQERDEFAVLIYRARKEYRSLNRRHYKGGRDHQVLIEGTFYKAQSIGYRGSINDWRQILWPGT